MEWARLGPCPTSLSHWVCPPWNPSSSYSSTHSSRCPPCLAAAPASGAPGPTWALPAACSLVALPWQAPLLVPPLGLQTLQHRTFGGNLASGPHPSLVGRRHRCPCTRRLARPCISSCHPSSSSSNRSRVRCRSTLFQLSLAAWRPAPSSSSSSPTSPTSRSHRSLGACPCPCSRSRHAHCHPRMGAPPLVHCTACCRIPRRSMGSSCIQAQADRRLPLACRACTLASTLRDPCSRQPRWSSRKRQPCCSEQTLVLPVQQRGRLLPPRLCWQRRRLQLARLLLVVGPAQPRGRSRVSIRRPRWCAGRQPRRLAGAAQRCRRGGRTGACASVWPGRPTAGSPPWCPPGHRQLPLCCWRRLVLPRQLGGCFPEPAGFRCAHLS